MRSENCRCARQRHGIGESVQMNLKKFLIVFLIAISISNPRAFAEIDWESGIVTASGYADSRDVYKQSQKFARRASIIDAQRKLALYCKEIYEFDLLSDSIKFDADPMYNVLAEDFFDGKYLVEISIPIYGKNSIASELFPKLISNHKPIPKIDSTILAPDEVESIKKLKFTALIIDIRGMKFEKSLAPNIYDPVGNLIYGFDYVDVNLAIDRGMVSYSKNRKDNRAGSNPIIINANNIDDHDIIVTRSDAERILIANQQSHFLENCNVIILY